MLRAIVVDDEPLTAALIRRYLEETGEVGVESVLSDPSQVVEEVSRLKPDVVFLDIEMPQRSGLEIAEELTMLDVVVEIVFITAFHAYAIEAFKVNALDYLLKPVQLVELRRVIGKIHKRITSREGHPQDQFPPSTGESIANKCRLKVSALGGFSVTVTDQQEPIRWSTSKCGELLAYLLFQKERAAVSKWKLMDVLWPEKDDEKSAINLRSTVCRLNKTLREHGVQGGVIAQKNTYHLELPSVIVDAFELEAYCRNGNRETISLQQFSQLYPGELFHQMEYEWASSLITHYMRLFVNVGKEIAESRMGRHSDMLTTLHMLERLLLVDPYNEDVQATMLTALCHQEGKKAVVRCQDAFVRQLADEIGVKPTQKLLGVYAALLETE